MGLLFGSISLPTSLNSPNSWKLCEIFGHFRLPNYNHPEKKEMYGCCGYSKKNMPWAFKLIPEMYDSVESELD